ncbi:hypothetical protein PV11_07406 [Exophiala sideris]|uniref:Mediator of RNA polymerase II transcription subunit 31 n=1 Tax=Exophiala sideris TaxID=1016849 RepID=A0A0D1YG32_9EURO|nr:hypothetical protein PV11_07406 [Exophiala sideris]
MDSTRPPAPLSHRFTLELEFVLCLANPHYLQYLAVNYPHLLNKPTASHSSIDIEESDAARFARYLNYLYDNWRTPQYAKYLTHPGATLRNLELLQQEQFRRDIIRPDVVAKLLETDASQIVAQDVSALQDPATDPEQPGA